MEWIHGSLKTMMMKRAWPTKRKRSTTAGWILSCRRNRQKATQIGNSSSSSQWVTALQLAISSFLCRILPVRAFSKEANYGEEPSITTTAATTTTVVRTTALQRRLQPALQPPLEKRPLCHVTVKNRQLSVSSISTMPLRVEEIQRMEPATRLQPMQPAARPAAVAEEEDSLKEVEEAVAALVLVIITTRPFSSCSHELESFSKNCQRPKSSGWPQPLEPIMLRRPSRPCPRSPLLPGRASRPFLAIRPTRPSPPTLPTHPTSSNWTNIISFRSARRPGRPPLVWSSIFPVKRWEKMCSHSTFFTPRNFCFVLNWKRNRMECVCCLEENWMGVRPSARIDIGTRPESF